MKFYKVILLFISSFFIGSVSTFIFVEHYYMKNADFEVILTDIHEGKIKISSKDPLTNQRYTSGIYPVSVSYSQRFIPDCKLSFTNCSKLY